MRVGVEGRVGVRLRAGARGLGFGVKGLGIRVRVAGGVSLRRTASSGRAEPRKFAHRLTWFGSGLGLGWGSGWG